MPRRAAGSAGRRRLTQRAVANHSSPLRRFQAVGCRETVIVVLHMPLSVPKGTACDGGCLAVGDVVELGASDADDAAGVGQPEVVLIVLDDLVEVVRRQPVQRGERRRPCASRMRQSPLRVATQATPSPSTQMLWAVGLAQALLRADALRIVPSRMMLTPPSRVPTQSAPLGS